MEIDFAKNLLKIGPFATYDIFGDGSLYLLDTPGHAVGHMSGLVRTTTNPGSGLPALRHFLWTSKTGIGARATYPGNVPERLSSLCSMPHSGGTPTG